jgi:hypothetical protein
MGRGNAREISIRKCEGKRPLGRPGRIQKDNIKMDLEEMMCELFIAVS